MTPIHQRHFILAASIAAFGCGGGAPAPALVIPVEVPEATAEPTAFIPPRPTPEDSAADAAALTALKELEFGSLGKGAEHIRGVLSPEAIVSRSTPRGGTASGTGPSFDIDVESFADHARVQYYSTYFLSSARDRFGIWLGRLTSYEGMIRAKLGAHGIPEDLVYLALIESGYSNTAVSRARAVGMWQFMSFTGRQYGLAVDDWVDERRDPFKATDAAARYLADLYERFGSWYLAAAAYNAGEGRVSRGIRRLPGGDSISDETFFDLSDRRYLRPETRDYVPKLIAAARIAKEPLRYGFDSIPFYPPVVFDEITVPDATGLDVVARLADTSTAALVELNPHYIRRITPPGRPSIVRVPRGSGPVVAQRYAELPASQRVTFLEHVVRRGETLSHISSRYRVSVSLIRGANGNVNPRRLRVGQRLIIPVAAAQGRQVSSAIARSATPPSSGYHTVRGGESLWTIARRYGVDVSELRRWNGMDGGETLVKVGQRLRVTG